jgi:prephenate dehydratase
MPETRDSANGIERIYVLGPAGTFSEQAAEVFRQWLTTQAAPSPKLIHTRSIEEATDFAASDQQAVAIVPIENSESGTVVVTQEELRAACLVIEWELSIPVRYTVLSKRPFAQVTRVLCHPVAHGQCTRFLRTQLAHAEVVYASSNAQAGEELAKAEVHPKMAAIVPSHYATPALESWNKTVDIQNSSTNTTRFVIARARTGARGFDFSRSKTSLVVIPKDNRPGLLAAVLSALGRRGLNLTRIESRPSRERPWTYVFYLDVENSAAIIEALPEMSRIGDEVVVLGTYDELPLATFASAGPTSA